MPRELSSGPAPRDWEQVYSSVGPRLFTYLCRLCGDRETAADLFQEAFVKAMRSPRSPAEPEEMAPWLYRIATNLALDHLRKERRRRLMPWQFVRRPGGEVDISDRELVREALRSIPPDQAAALVLRLHEGRSRREIGELLGLSEDGVKSRLLRGRAAFERAYRQLEARSR